MAQAEAGAEVLDVNAGLPGIDEPATLEQLVRDLQAVTDLPLQLDSSNPDALSHALRIYNGKPIVTSVNGEQSTLDMILPPSSVWRWTSTASLPQLMAALPLPSASSRPPTLLASPTRIFTLTA